MAIKPAKELLDMYVVTNCMLAASITVSVGDAVIINTAVPQTVTPNGTNTTAAIFGTVLAIGQGPATGNTFPQRNSITTASDNVTNAQYNVDVLLSNNLATLIADLDANVGTTTNSQYFGYFSMLSGTAGKLQESSYNTSPSSRQFLSFGAVPGVLNQVYGIWNTSGRI